MVVVVVSSGSKTLFPRLPVFCLISTGGWLSSGKDTVSYLNSVELATLTVSLRGLCLTPASLQDSLCHPAHHCSLQAALSRLGRKIPCLDAVRLTFRPTQILSILHVNVYPLAWTKKNCFLQEVCNKSLAIDDNGICACVCHLRKSNSGGVSTDLFVY